MALMQTYTAENPIQIKKIAMRGSTDACSKNRFYTLLFLVEIITVRDAF